MPETAPPPSVEAPKAVPQKPKTPSLGLKTPKLSDLLKVEAKPQEAAAETEQKTGGESKPFTDAELKKVWTEFAEQRKQFQAEYLLLMQDYTRQENLITVYLHNPIQDTILNTIKSDLIGYLREKLNNYLIMITGEMKEEEGRKVIYTNREKLEYLIAKNPALKELKDRLGLDTDY